MSESLSETDITQLASQILGNAVKRSDIKKGELNPDQTLAASSWLGHMSSKRLEALNDRMVKWTATAGIASSAAATLSLITLIIILLGLR